MDGNRPQCVCVCVCVRACVRSYWFVILTDPSKHIVESSAFLHASCTKSRRRYPGSQNTGSVLWSWAPRTELRKTTEMTIIYTKDIHNGYIEQIDTMGTRNGYTKAWPFPSHACNTCYTCNGSDTIILTVRIRPYQQVGEYGPHHDPGDRPGHGKVAP